MFTQLQAHRDRAQGGLGIGLTLARRLVEMHGGTIEAQSEGLGSGSRFIVQLPVTPDAHAEDDVRGRESSVRRPRVPGADRGRQSGCGRDDAPDAGVQGAQCPGRRRRRGGDRGRPNGSPHRSRLSTSACRAWMATKRRVASASGLAHASCSSPSRVGDRTRTSGGRGTPASIIT